MGLFNLKDVAKNFGIKAASALNLESTATNFGVEAAKALNLKEVLENAGVGAARVLNLEGSLRSLGAEAATILNLKDSLQGFGANATTTFGANLESGLKDIGLSATKALPGLISGLAFKYAVAQSLLYIGDHILSYIKSGYLSDSYIKEVELLLEEKLFNEALATINKALDIHPDVPLYKLKKADILFELKDFGRAAIEYKQALSLVKDDRSLENNILINLSSLYYNMQRYDDAILYLNRIIATQSDKITTNSVFYYNIGSCYEKKGAYTEAVKYFQKAVDIDADKSEYFTKLGFSKGKIGLFLEAIQSYNKALNLNPTDQKTLLYLGLVYMEVRNYKEAIIALDKLVKNNLSSQYYIVRGIAYLLSGDNQIAKTNFIKAIELDSTSHVGYYYLGQIYISKGSNDKALYQYLNAVKYAEQQGYYNDEYYIKTADTYFSLGNDIEAIKLYIKAIDTNIQHPLHLSLDKDLIGDHINKYLKLQSANAYEEAIILGKIYFLLGVYNNALIKYKEALKFNDVSSEGYECIGDIELQIANYKSAEEYYLKAIASNKTDVYYHKLADLYLEFALISEDGNTYYNKAILNYQAANTFKQCHLHYAGLGGAYYLFEKFEDALNSYKLALEHLDKNKSKFIENIEERYNAALGNIYLKLGQYTEASLIFNRLLENNPTEHSYYAGLAEAHVASGKSYLAIKKYIKSLDYCTITSVRSYYNKKLIDLYIEAKDYDKAYDQFLQRVLHQKYSDNKEIKRAVFKNLPPTSSHASRSKVFATLADLYYELGFYEESIYAYTKAQENSEPEINMDYFEGKARAYLKLGNYDAVIKSYQHLQQKSLCSDVCDNKIGNAYFASGNYSLAAHYYGESIINKPNKAIYYNNLGSALYKSGNLKEAVMVFEKLTKLDDKTAVYFNNLGASYFNLKNYSLAKAAFEQAISVNSVKLIYKQHLTQINSIINMNKHDDTNQGDTQSSVLSMTVINNQSENAKLQDILLYEHDSWSMGSYFVFNFIGVAIGFVPCLIFRQNVAKCLVLATLGSFGINIALGKLSSETDIAVDETLKIITLDITESKTDIIEEEYANNLHTIGDSPSTSYNLYE